MSSHALTHLSLAEERTPFRGFTQVQNISHTHRQKEKKYGESKFFFLLSLHTHHKLTPHSRDYVFLRRLIKNNSSLSFFLPASGLIALPSLNNKTKPGVFGSVPGCWSSCPPPPLEKKSGPWRFAAFPPHPLRSLPHRLPFLYPSVSPPQSLLQSAAQHCRLIIPFPVAIH